MNCFVQIIQLTTDASGIHFTRFKCDAHADARGSPGESRGPGGESILTPCLPQLRGPFDVFCSGNTLPMFRSSIFWSNERRLTLTMAWPGGFLYRRYWDRQNWGALPPEARVLSRTIIAHMSSSLSDEIELHWAFWRRSFWGKQRTNKNTGRGALFYFFLSLARSR